MSTADSNKDQVFLRKASGLVKAAGAFDVFIFNLGTISVGIAITLAHFFVPSNYAGASLPIAELLSAGFMLCIAWGFWCWSVVIPRSGGIYTFVSRGVSPAIGFSVSFVDALTFLFYNALAATYITTIGIAPALFTVGYLTNTKTLISAAVALQSPWAQFAVGAFMLSAGASVLIIGMRAFFRLQKILLAIAFLGTVVTLFVLLTADPTQFVSHFDAAFQPFLPNAHSQITKAASGVSTFSMRATVLAAVWPLLSYIGGIASVNIGGEVRNARRSQFIGIFGSIIVSGVIMATLSVAGDRVFGMQFQQGLGAFATGENASSLPLTPYFSVLAGLATKSPVLALMVCLGFLAWAFFWIPSTIAYVTRALIAWSFDRVAPSACGYVHPTRHTPVTAICVVLLANLVLLALFLFTPFFKTLVLVLATMLAWIPTMLGAVLLPKTRSEIFQQSPMANQRLLGIPLISVAGTVGLVAVVVLTILLWNDSVAAGHSLQSIGTIVVVFLTGAIWYQAVRAFRIRQGIRIDRAFAEIPIE